MSGLQRMQEQASSERAAADAGAGKQVLQQRTGCSAHRDLRQVPCHEAWLARGALAGGDQASSIRHQASRIGHQAFGIRQHTIIMPRPAPHL